MGMIRPMERLPIQPVHLPQYRLWEGVKYAGLGQDDLTRVLLDFVKFHFNAVSDLCLYGNFVCYMTTLQQAGLITQEAMVDVSAQMQGKMDSKSTKGLHADPMTDITVHFPTLEMITDNNSPEGPCA